MIDIEKRAAQIERELRAEGVDAMLIPPILGAAFLGSLTNLPRHARVLAIVGYLEAVGAAWSEAEAMPQAPPGPMPGL